jgi:hypothetical protein
MARTKKTPLSPVDPSPAPAEAAKMPEFCEGALWALAQLGEVLWDRRQGMHRLDLVLSYVPPEERQILADVLEPLGGGMNDAVLNTVRRRLEERVTEECKRRMGIGTQKEDA